MSESEHEVCEVAEISYAETGQRCKAGPAPSRLASEQSTQSKLATKMGCNRSPGRCLHYADEPHTLHRNAAQPCAFAGMTLAGLVAALTPS